MIWDKFDIRNLSNDEYFKWYSLMCEEQKKRVDRFRFADDKKRTVVGEMVARTMIAKYCNVLPESITFDIGEHGKPYVVELDVHFNISHSGNMVVCAVSDKPVGIDIEQIRPIDLRVAKRVFNEDELQYLFGFSPTDKDFILSEDTGILTRFFEVWTAKEATVKCSGIGIADIKNVVLYEQISKLIIDNYIISIA